MKKGKHMMFLCAVVSFMVLLAACGQSDDTDTTKKQETAKETEDISKSDDASVGDTNNTAQDDAEVKEENSSDGNENDDEESNKGGVASVDNQQNEDTNADGAEIASMDDAIEYLQEQLDAKGEVDLEDTEFLPSDDSAASDDKGSYYTISLVSKSMQEGGGSGTVGKYKVYQNGEYEMAY
ncbi:hypothetical protein WMZ97_01370 [Lentibacillus sp. N15]|uniref:hypothetical protein n=1 Tax=Lentibacillus songyuanensis TaxID=3136161 RepID=UPI0031BAE59A